MKRLILLVCIAFLSASMVSCGSQEEKKMKFLEKGKTLYEQGDYVKARLEFKNALQIDPKFADGYDWMGMIRQHDGSFKQAFGAFAKAAELDPDHLKAQLQLGRLSLLSRNTDQALEKAELILAKEPDNVDALILKATGLLTKKDNAAAIALMKGLVDQGNTEPNVYLTLGSAYLRNENRPEAEKIYGQGIEANPDTVNLRLALAKLYNDDRRFEDAISVMQKVIELEPDRAVYRMTLAGVYWDSGQHSAAFELLDRLLVADPANEDNRLTVARFYTGKNQFGQAEQVLKKGIEQHPKSFKPRIMLGELYVSLKRPYQAIQALEECLTLDEDPANPGIISAKNALADIYLKLRQVDKAETYIDEVVRDSPKSIDAHYNKGSLYLLKADGVNAVSEFRTVIGERPGFIPAYLRLANAHVLNDELDLALDTLQNALKVNPASKDVRRAMARIYLLQKDNKAAEAQLRKILEIDPADSVARADLGDFLLSVKDIKGAEEEFQLIKDATPHNPLGYIKLYGFYVKQGKTDKALEALEEGYSQNPQSGPLLSGLVQEYVRQSKHQAAIALCEGRISKNSKDVVSYYLLGFVQGSLKSYPAAEAALQKAIDLQPMWPPPHQSLAGIYLAQGKKQEAIQKYEASLQANPRNAAAYLSLGLLYEKDRQFDNAMQVYERALTADPNFWFAANNLAFLLSEFSDQKADLDRALELSQKALKQRPGDPAILDTIGWVYYRLGDFSKAQGLIEQALAGAPDSAILNYHMGMALYKTDQIEEAREKLEKALAGDDEFTGRKEAEETLNKIKA